MEESALKLIKMVILFLAVFVVILYLILLFFKQGSVSLAAKEFCLLTIGKFFGKAEICEVFI